MDKVSKERNKFDSEMDFFLHYLWSRENYFKHTEEFDEPCSSGLTSTYTTANPIQPGGQQKV